MPSKTSKNKLPISDIQPTDERLTSRGGLTLFQRYLNSTGWPDLLAETFSYLRKNAKGIGVKDFFEQIFAFWADGTGQHLTYFDQLKKDEGYAAGLERTVEQLMSSHQVKRLFEHIPYIAHAHFRVNLHRMFLWRIREDKPEVIKLGMDTMVMDNDQAPKREGAEPTYRGVKGFQPFQITWKNTIVDAVFRGGSKHSNHGDTALNALKYLIPKIRNCLGEDIPIIVRIDSGFFDQALLDWMDNNNIGYVVAGKAYADLKDYVEKLDDELFQRFEGETNSWDYVEFGDRRGNWNRGRRVVFTRPVCEKGQYVLFHSASSFWYTNLGMGMKIDKWLKDSKTEKGTATEDVIELAHGRGAEELTHRHLKDFGWEQMPFQQFESNMGFYYVMVMAFNLFEAFKDDIGTRVFPEGAYPRTIRRKWFDVAGKVVSHAGQIVLKIARGAYENLKLALLWRRANAPPAIA